ncbi:VPA1262 family protein [Pseudoalteromonas rhizosphaerae]|uniref:VPA1262 family protein n=1 Tax=Pseudoalteromonas rhizosphaerae TaxID=2518973 RepID=UPI001230AB60|nr:VPA1262 family protein [Pseudoalteromonas rhizosphaerae]
MSFKLENLLKDPRLARLFSSQHKHCAFQFWVLQLQNDDISDNRLIYGRLLPYSFSNNSWSFSHNDNFRSFGTFKATVTKLNLYIDSSLCGEFLQMACEGRTIESINKALKLKTHQKFNPRFGETILADQSAVYRPISYLLNRDAHLQGALTSPHGSAGALSASISRCNKQSLFRWEDNYNKELTSMIVNLLNEDTGMDFGGKDISRFCDIELLVFPTIDENEISLLDVTWNRGCDLNVRFNSSQLPTLDCFQFQLTIENNNQVVCSKVLLSKSDNELFECSFKLEDPLCDIADSARIDIFSFKENEYGEGELCCSWKLHYIREANIQMHLVGNHSSPVKFDWLEKTTTPQTADRVSSALSLSKSDNLSPNKVGGRKVDKWVPEKKELNNLFSKLYPPKSDGNFFLRWGQSNGEGRIQFVEWFKALLQKNAKQHIAIFDPYFEDVGVSLLTLSAIHGSEYSIFRSLPKTKDNSSQGNIGSNDSINRGVDNLIANCEHNRKLLKRSKVTIYGIKEGRLHDRYILVIGKNGLPVEGYHLSNSFQTAAENYPLLITPIPTDVLYKTNQYTFELIREANNPLEQGNEQKLISVLFNSSSEALSEKTKLYDPLSILDREIAGTVLSIWFQQPSLKGLSGDDLRSEMTAQGILQRESLISLTNTGLFNCLEEIEGELSDFMASWEVIADILAHIPTGDSSIDELKSETKFLAFLSEFLSYSLRKKPSFDHQETSVIAPNYFKQTLHEFIHSSLQIQHFVQSTKYKPLTWAEYYAVKYLWKFSPGALIALVERESKLIATEYQLEDVVRLSILGQVVSEISLSSEFDAISEKQNAALIKSNIAMLKWFGWNSLEQQLQSSVDLSIDKLSDLSNSEQLLFLGWAINKNAKNPKNQLFYENQINLLYELLPDQIPFCDLESIIDSLRGHMYQLGWAEPWLFKDVIEPLLHEKRVSFEEVCKIWLEDLIKLLNDQNSNHYFSSEHDGQTTNVCAYLWANSETVFQNDCIKTLKTILEAQRRIIQQPLASTSNWYKWDEALKISLWILVFAKWGKYYLNNLNIFNHEQLDLLLENAHSLALKRPTSEWRAQSELFEYMEKIDELINELSK